MQTTTDVTREKEKKSPLGQLWLLCSPRQKMQFFRTFFHDLFQCLQASSATEFPTPISL